MSLKRFEADANETLPLVKRTGSVFGAAAAALVAVGAVAVYAFVGGSSIPKTEASGISEAQRATTSVAEVTADVEESDTEAVAEIPVVTQAAQTWKKASIEEYDLVLETVKATETTTTESTTKAQEQTKKSETETETETKKQTEKVEETTTKATTTTAATTTVQVNASVSAESQQSTEEPEEEEVKPCSVRTMYTNDKVNMRKGPSLDNDVIKVIPDDSEILVTGYTSDWYRIKHEGKVGYCMKRYTTEKPAEEEAVIGKDVISYTEAEFEMLCYVLQGEVGNCSEESKIAVANVIINRVKSSAFPNSIEGVLTQANQFTAIYNYYNRTNSPSENTRECARRALGGEDNSNGAIYYYAPRYCSGATVSWFESLTFCMEIDGQRYFK